MLGVEGYGSDNDSDNESLLSQPTPSKPTLASKLPPPTKKSSLALPPPTSSSASTSSSKRSSGLSLPPPKSKKGPKKVAIGLPALSKDDDEDAVNDRPPSKKPRLEAGAGSSGLLAMLPAPKNAVPVAPAPERVLGGGRGPGLVFNTGFSRPSQKVTLEDAEEDADKLESTSVDIPPSGSSILEEVKQDKTTPSLPFLPPSLVRGKANISVEEKHTRPLFAQPKPPTPAIDFFGLGSSSSSSSAKPSTSKLVSSAPSIRTRTPVSSLPLPGFSSAPEIDEFIPPEPTPQDPYPGYYLLPSGSWAAYDQGYYQKFYSKWKREYDKHVRALEKGAEKGFEALETEGAQEVNALREMEKAKVEIQEREEKKALTSGAGAAPAVPKMNIKGAALSGRARTRHQLSSLLSEAYQNRETLEEQIAQGRRNRKEAGNKYGF